MALHCRWVWLSFVLFAPRCTPIPLFHLESWFSQCEKPSRSGEVCRLCGWAAASTGNESETQRTLAGLQIIYRIITGLWSQMTCPQILYNRSGFSSKFKWLAAVVRAITGQFHLVTSIWCYCFSMQSWYTEWNVSQICRVFGCICPFHLA